MAVVITRSATPRELHQRIRNFRMTITKTEDGKFTATVDGQPHLAATAAKESDAVRDLKATVNKEFLNGSMKVDGKFI